MLRTLFAASTLFAATVTLAQDWHVSPDGKESNVGTPELPWDIASALGGGKKVGPGDTVWLKAGTYKHPNRKPGTAGYEVRLSGTPDNPIQVRGESGKRVTINGGLQVVSPSNAVWIRDLEITLSEPSREVSKPNIPLEEMGRPWGGLEIRAGAHCKYINLIIHNNSQGVGFWSGATESEIYGCIIYNNGWKGPDRGHGHCIYSQNKDGLKTISNCILQARFEGSYTMHAYGSSRAFVDNYFVTENIAYGRGPFLIGGGKPSHNIRVLKNVLHNVDLKLGYSAPENEDCEVRDNQIFNGGLLILKFKKAINENNRIIRKVEGTIREPQTFLFPNKYDNTRAHAAVLNPTKRPQVALKLDIFAKPGETLALFDPQDLFGKPIWEGKVENETVLVPTPSEFNVYVLQKR